jgi:mono/diheme cytochrome c family protein
MAASGDGMTGVNAARAVAAIVIAIIVFAIGAGLYAAAGFYNIAADAPHTRLVRDFVSYMRRHSIAVRVRDVKVPRLDDRKMIVEGAEHYDAMCTGCHLAPGKAENEMRPGMNPKPPILGKTTGTPAEMFWTIKHGIKMTGMPAWGVTHSDAEIWNMVAFLKVLPRLTPAQYRALVAQGGDHHDHDQMDMSH